GEVKRMGRGVIRDGRMGRPSLGVTGGPPDLNRTLGLPKGVALVRVQRGGPAARAGIRAFSRGENGIVQGDVLTAIGDQPVETLDDMLTALERLQPGETCTVTLWRNGTTRKATVTLGESDD